MRDFSWLDVVFGFFLAALLLGAATVVLSFVAVALPDGMIFTGRLDFIYLLPAFLAAGMAFFAWKCPGPGRIVEVPALTLAAISVWLLLAALTGAGVLPSWVAFLAFQGLFVTTLVGFAVFFAIYSEAKKVPQAKTTWPIDRPASSGWWGMRAFPRNQGMVYAGLQRGGTEEHVPDTIVRMKTKE